MRLCIDARTMQDHFPGIGAYTYALISHLAPLAPDDDLLVLVDPSAMNSRFDLNALGAWPNVQLMAAPWELFGLTQQWSVPQLLCRERVALYHSPYYLMSYCVPCPMVVTVHDLIPQVMPQSLPRPELAPLFRLLVGLAVSRAAHVVADSEATRNDLMARCRVPAGRVTAIPLAADAHLRPVPAEAFRRQEGLERPYLLYLGTNKPHKNLAALVRAWGALPATVRNDRQLVVAGYQDARYPEARLLAAALGDSVRWLGPVAHADLAALYSGAQWFVFPSLYEGFGLPVLEAMACGTPVACSRASSLPEVVGEAGLTFDPRDEREMRAVLTRLLEDGPLRVEMAARALARAGQFSWEATARATYAVYRAVLGHKER